MSFSNHFGSQELTRRQEDISRDSLHWSIANAKDDIWAETEIDDAAKINYQFFNDKLPSATMENSEYCKEVLNYSFPETPSKVIPEFPEPLSYNNQKGLARYLFSEQTKEQQKLELPEPLSYNRLKGVACSLFNEQTLGQPKLENSGYYRQPPNFIFPGTPSKLAPEVPEQLCYNRQKEVARSLFSEQAIERSKLEVPEPLIYNRQREVAHSSFNKLAIERPKLGNFGYQSQPQNFSFPGTPSKLFPEIPELHSYNRQREVTRSLFHEQAIEQPKLVNTSECISLPSKFPSFNDWSSASSSERTPSIEEETDTTSGRANEYNTPKKWISNPSLNGNKPREIWNYEKKSKPTFQRGKTLKGDGCRFCLSNKEVTEFCYTHKLKDSQGNVTCPILRNYVCPTCNATGPTAHTKRHCPLYEPKTSVRLKKGCVMRRNAAGHLVTTRV